MSLAPTARSPYVRAVLKPEKSRKESVARPAPASALLAIALGITVAPLHAGENPWMPPLSRQPVVEVASFGVAPVAGLTEDTGVQAEVADTRHSSRHPLREESAPPEIETRVSSGETWTALLDRIARGLDGSALVTSPAVTARMELLPPLEAGRYVRARSRSDGQFIVIDYVVTPQQAYSITMDGAGVTVQPHASDPRLVDRMRADPSKASLFTATDAIGLPDAIVLQLADIFSDDVDFQRDLHQGYRGTLVYEVYYREGHIDRAGRILAAEFTLRGKSLQAFYFDDHAGHAGYYTETGWNVKKSFRRSPVEFSRVTSAYTLARFHPILGLWRAHRGIDYAAPLGSKVLATADGVVQFAGDRGQLGNLVILRHYGRYLTYYGHLNAFAKGIAPGRKVKKGQAIGFVGMTGLATGPHVHYEFRVGDGSGDGPGVPLPPPNRLEEPPMRSAGFFKAVQRYRTQFQASKTAHVVILQ